MFPAARLDNDNSDGCLCHYFNCICDCICCQNSTTVPTRAEFIQLEHQIVYYGFGFDSLACHHFKFTNNW